MWSSANWPRHLADSTGAAAIYVGMLAEQIGVGRYGGLSPFGGCRYYNDLAASFWRQAIVLRGSPALPPASAAPAHACAPSRRQGTPISPMPGHRTGESGVVLVVSELAGAGRPLPQKLPRAPPGWGSGQRSVTGGRMSVAVRTKSGSSTVLAGGLRVADLVAASFAVAPRG